MSRLLPLPMRREGEEGKIWRGEVEAWEVTWAAASRGWVVVWDSLLRGEASGKLVCAQVCVHMSVYVMWLQAGQGQSED